MIDWKKVDHNHFEKFVYHVLLKLDFRNLQWHGKGGGDKGRDVVAYTYEKLPFNLGYERKWVFQCKKWSRFPDPTTITNDLLSAAQHNLDFWVLVIPVNPSSAQIDYFDKLNESHSFKIILVPLVKIENFLSDYHELINILLEGELKIGGNN